MAKRGHKASGKRRRRKGRDKGKRGVGFGVRGTCEFGFDIEAKYIVDGDDVDGRQEISDSVVKVRISADRVFLDKNFGGSYPSDFELRVMSFFHSEFFPRDSVDNLLTGIEQGVKEIEEIEGSGDESESERKEEK